MRFAHNSGRLSMEKDLIRGCLIYSTKPAWIVAIYSYAIFTKMISNSYINLGQGFFHNTPPESVRDPSLFLWNNKLAFELTDSTHFNLPEGELAEIFSGNKSLPGAEPIALAYAGHQFGNFVPQLGDGRAHLLGEIVDLSGKRRDIQLKGSGQTAFSRNGDGRYALGPAIREFIMGEAMHALGIPTTRSLAVVTTGETVYRDTKQPGAVLTRIAASHLRVGTFEYFSARQDEEAIQRLADYAIERHFPELAEGGEARFIQLFDAVMQRQIDLVVEWMRVGFIHGVMNTDNTAISGETIDYGPCAMMGTYSPTRVFSSIDRQGRYAFGNQPSIAQWNLARFAETLLPLIHPQEKSAVDIARNHLDEFSDRFRSSYLEMMRRKIGVDEIESGDDKLIFSLLTSMERNQLDYTTTFDRLTRSLSSPETESMISDDLGDWYPQWRQRLEAQSLSNDVESLMRQSNPVVIPNNYHMEQVIAGCLESGETAAAEEFLDVLSSPYSVSQKTLQYQLIPADADIGYQTFCGT
jgi:uncharacterized protein YdiU (UPF0061 family)